MSAVLYAQGYQHASDKLLQMEISRRTVFGTLSEFYGNSTVKSDKLFRTLNFVDLAREDYQVLGSTGKELLDAYAAGVNAYLFEASASQTAARCPLTLICCSVYAPDLFPSCPERLITPWHCSYDTILSCRS